jgi:hypothetical protein
MYVPGPHIHPLALSLEGVHIITTITIIILSTEAQCLSVPLSLTQSYARTHSPIFTLCASPEYTFLHTYVLLCQTRYPNSGFSQLFPHLFFRGCVPVLSKDNKYMQSIIVYSHNSYSIYFYNPVISLCFWSSKGGILHTYIHLGDSAHDHVQVHLLLYIRFVTILCSKSRELGTRIF